MPVMATWPRIMGLQDAQGQKDRSNLLAWDRADTRADRVDGNAWQKIGMTA